MSLSEADALYAAAYRVVLEKLDPDGCTDGPHYSVLTKTAEDLRVWARGQTQDVAAAYERAVTDIAKRAESVLENNVRARQMTAAYSSIPKPP